MPARYGVRQPAAGLSWGHAIRNHLEEDAARAHRHAIVVPSINSSVLPAAPSAGEILTEDVPSAAPWLCFDWVAAAFLVEPDRLQVTLPAKGWLHITTGDEPPRSLHGSKAERTSVGRVVRDLIRGFHRAHFGNQQEGKEFCESPVSRGGAAYTSRSNRNGIQSSTVKWLKRRGWQEQRTMGNCSLYRKQLLSSPADNECQNGAHCPITLSG